MVPGISLNIQSSEMTRLLEQSEEVNGLIGRKLAICFFVSRDVFFAFATKMACLALSRPVNRLQTFQI